MKKGVYFEVNQILVVDYKSGGSCQNCEFCIVVEYGILVMPRKRSGSLYTGNYSKNLQLISDLLTLSKGQKI